MIIVKKKKLDIKQKKKIFKYKENIMFKCDIQM